MKRRLSHPLSFVRHFPGAATRHFSHIREFRAMGRRPFRPMAGAVLPACRRICSSPTDHAHRIAKSSSFRAFGIAHSECPDTSDTKSSPGTCASSAPLDRRQVRIQVLQTPGVSSKALVDPSFPGYPTVGTCPFTGTSQIPLLRSATPRSVPGAKACPGPVCRNIPRPARAVRCGAALPAGCPQRDRERVALS